MFHVFMLLLTLSGQPVDILRSVEEFDTKAACDAVLPKATTDLQTQLDASTNGQVKVGKSACLTDADLEALKASKAL